MVATAIVGVSLHLSEIRRAFDQIEIGTPLEPVESEGRLDLGGDR